MESTPVISGLRLVADPASRSALLQHLNAWVDAVRRSPGCMRATLAEQEGDPNVLYATVEWEDEQAVEAFRTSQLSKDLTRPLAALLAAKPQTIRFGADEVDSGQVGL